MVDLKPVIAKNITALRQNHKMTQIELAEKLNYSDKAVSKWERGESIPDVMVLKAIADMFGVTLDYLLEEDHLPVEEKKEKKPASRVRNRAIVTLLSLLIVWFLATLIFAVMDTFWPDMQGGWMAFLYAVPVSMIVWLVFNSIWFNTRRNYLIISLLMWTSLATLFINAAVMGYPVWKFLFLGIPGQIAIYAWSRFQLRSEE